ncbi:MAG: ankyrin repeat domain-containing protein [Odoribacteraceae bacterium]|nr:ankyrin repeat domain-containing protein [Odoribacteraceae bacterium]
MQPYEIKRLHDAGASPAEIAEAYKTALAENIDGAELITLAAGVADPRALTLLLEAGVDPRTRDNYNNTLLHHLARLEHAKPRLPPDDDIAQTANILLRQQINPSRLDDSEHLCCYHHAARAGNHPFIAALAQNGVNLARADNEGNTAIHIAARNAIFAINNLQYATRDVQRDREKLDAAANLGESWQKSYRDTLAASQKRQADAQRLVDNYLRVVQTLAQNGVDKDEKNQYGRTALEIAIQTGALEIAAYISGATIATAGMNLHQAIIKNNNQALNALLDEGADPDALLDGEPADDSRRYLGHTPLAVACARKNLDAVTTLLQRGATPNLKTAKGTSPLAHLADTADAPSMQTVFKEKTIGKILQVIINAGHGINETVNDQGDTFITHALKRAPHLHHNNDLLKNILVDEALRHHPDINQPNHDGETPLILACREQTPETENTIITLLDAGANPNHKDRHGNTPLHHAAANPTGNIAKNNTLQLLDYNADPAAVNNQGQTPLDIAVATSNEPLVKLLLTRL